MKLSTKDRFDSKVDKVDGGCWLWKGGIEESGYGVFYPNRLRRQRAHRVSYEMHVGRVPSGLYVCHRCDVRNCVNPSHLFLGTQKDNMADMASKGRRVWGPTRWKLTQTETAEIAELVAFGIPQTAVADAYGLWQSHVSRIHRKINML